MGKPPHALAYEILTTAINDLDGNTPRSNEPQLDKSPKIPDEVYEC